LCKLKISAIFIYLFKFNLRNRKAFVITETELKLIAKAAIIGESKIPKNAKLNFSFVLKHN